ncbi:MAG: hypothetical protein MUP44_10320, partial [Anaerolineales bacterium]|nr:hypothetical protein [Anaerolineales bacterium]
MGRSWMRAEGVFNQPRNGWPADVAFTSNRINLEHQKGLSGQIALRVVSRQHWSIELGSQRTTVQQQISGDARPSTHQNPPEPANNFESFLSRLREDDLARMRRSYLQLLITEPDPIQAYGQQLFARIAVPNWSVEWNLPRWLGDALGLSEAQQRQLVAATVFGLGYVRLHDDRRDGEAASGSGEISRRLELLLKQAAESELRALLGEHRWFWEQYQRDLGHWHQASRNAQLLTNVFEVNPGSLIQLGDIGAPLLIVCAAGYALQTGKQSLELLTTPVRHYLAAVVLYDHLKDWQEDLAAGRPNLFITAMLGATAGDKDPEEIRAALYQAWLQS